MAATFTPDYDVTEAEGFEPSGRRRKITKFALAGVAVLGVGAALTSAAWTDNVWFGGDAESGTADLTGSVNGVDFEDGLDEGGLELEMGMFTLGPLQVSTDTVWVQNEGDVPLRLSAVDPEGTGYLFQNHLSGNTEGAATVVASGEGTILQPGETLAITVTVTGGDWDEDEYQDETGRIVLHVEGTTDL